MKIRNSYGIITFLFLAFLISCKKEIKETNENSTAYSVYKDSIPPSKKRQRLIKLKPKVKTNMEESPSFSLFKSYIDSLNTTSISNAEEITSILIGQLEELKAELPEKLKTKGINSRLEQIKNYCLKTEFNFRKRIVDTTIIKENIDQILLSHNALMIQLNESQARLPKEVEEELKQNKTIKKDTIEGTPLF